MKSIGKKLAVLTLAVIFVFTFASCGGDKYADSPCVGTWKATTAEYSGIELSVESVLGGEMVFALDTDGSCKLTIGDDSESGKWEETEKGFKVEDEFEFAVDGDTATMDYEGMTMHFEKK